MLYNFVLFQVPPLNSEKKSFIKEIKEVILWNDYFGNKVPCNTNLGQKNTSMNKFSISETFSTM